jgi:HSP20 family protein
MRLTNLTPWKRNGRNALARSGHDPFASLQRDIGQLFEGFFDGGPMSFANQGLLMSPKLDLSETDNELHVTAELPGLKEEDIDVEVTGDSLRIRGEKKDERDEKQHNFHRVERSFGLFERVVPLHVEVNREQVQATYKDGVLTVVLPKAVTAPASQKVTVKPGT